MTQSKNRRWHLFLKIFQTIGMALIFCSSRNKTTVLCMIVGVMVFVTVILHQKLALSSFFTFINVEYLKKTDRNENSLNFTEKITVPDFKCDLLLLQNLRKRLSPLAPITQRLEFAVPPFNKTQRNFIYETGTCLEKITYKNVTTWREFGVTYIPSTLTNLTRTNIANVFNSDYVPWVAYEHDLFFEGRKHEKVPDSQRKIILAQLAVLDPIKGLKQLKACPDFPCLHTTNFAAYFQNASAITFDASWYRGLKDTSVAPKRRPDQVFILYLYEAATPRNVFKNKANGWMDAFNWTMSHHADADIFMPYGMIRKRPTPIEKDYDAIVRNKSNFAAAFISNCRCESKRHEYIQQLQKYIPVHVYGGCGPYKCKRQDDSKCFSKIGKEYKFYLAFENSICSDYITEKLFKNLKSDAVIVVRGPSTYYRHLPEGIYINTQDYKTPKDLAKFLQYLDHNDAYYLNILRRKDQFFAAYESYPHRPSDPWINYNWENVPLCEVCQRLWNIDLYSQVYPDIDKWYQERQCRQPTDL